MGRVVGRLFCGEGATDRQGRTPGGRYGHGEACYGRGVNE